MTAPEFRAVESERVLAACLYAGGAKRDAVLSRVEAKHATDRFLLALLSVLVAEDVADLWMLRQKVAATMAGTSEATVATELDSLRALGAQFVDPEKHIDAVHEAWRKREVLHWSAAAYQQAKRGEVEEASLSFQQAQDIAAGVEQKRETSLGQAAHAAYKRAARIAEGEELSGFLHGLPSVDDCSGGGRPGEICMVGAKAKMGKSELVMQVVEHMASNGQPCEVFSLEMPPEGYGQRHIAANAPVRAALLRRGEMSEEKWARAFSVAKSAADLPIWLHDEPGLTVAKFRALMQSAIRRRGSRVAVIDYAQLLTYEPGSSREERASNTSRALKRTVRELGVYLLLLSQFPNGASPNELPSPERFRESGAWAQDCDRAIIKHRFDRGEENERMMLWHCLERWGDLAGKLEYQWDPMNGGHVELGRWSETAW